MKEKFCSRVITIPQFTGTCWFNAILMCVFYSQRMRKLLLDNMHTWEHTPLFNLFRDILQDNFIKTKNGEEQYKFFNKNKPEKILEMLHKHDKDEFDFDPKVQEGNSIEGYFVKLLNLLNVNTTLLFRFEGKTGVEQLDSFNQKIVQNHECMAYNSNTNFEYPDVLIISRYFLFQIKRQYQLIKDGRINFIKFKDFDKLSIKYNDQIYDLDCSCLSNFNSMKLKNNNKHAVAGITCKGKRYFYNGWTYKTKDPAMQGKSQLLREACPLIEFDWTSNQDIKFCINKRKCALDIKSKTDEEELCFNFNNYYNRLIFVRRKGTTDDVSKTSLISIDQVYNQRKHQETNAKPQKINQKECPEGKILNPKTNRCVDKSGNIGKQLLKETHQKPPETKQKPKEDKQKPQEDKQKPQETKQKPPEDKQKPKEDKQKPQETNKKECPVGKILNPKTNRCVDKSGKIGKQLLKNM